MEPIRTITPDGRELRIRRNGDQWFVRCGKSQAESVSLDAAMIDALRGVYGSDGHRRHIDGVDYGAWVRRHARAIEDFVNLEG